MQAHALRAFVIQCARYSDMLLRNDPRIDELNQTDLTILRSVVDYWTMMDPRNPVFDLAPLNADDFLVFPGYLTPSSPTDIDGITLHGKVSDLSEHKTIATLDPDIFIQFPISTMSPMGSDDESSPEWDWDSELSAF